LKAPGISLKAPGISLKAPGFSLKAPWYQLESAWFKLESAWFQLESALVSSLGTLDVIYWFQAFAFKWVNSYRYTTVDAWVDAPMRPRIDTPSVGLYKLNLVDP
jgi:hypothetical protein